MQAQDSRYSFPGCPEAAFPLEIVPGAGGPLFPEFFSNPTSAGKSG